MWQTTYSHSQQSIRFWNRYNVSWPCRPEPSSDRTVPTTAVCSVREPSKYQVTWSAPYCYGQSIWLRKLGHFLPLLTFLLFCDTIRIWPEKNAFLLFYLLQNSEFDGFVSLPLLVFHYPTCHTSPFVKQAPGNDRDYYHRKLLMVLGQTPLLETPVVIIMSENWRHRICCPKGWR